MLRIALLLVMLNGYLLHGQEDVILGAGGIQPQQVLTSDNHQYQHWDKQASGENTTNGNGLNFDELSMARFLAQSTLGANSDYVRSVSDQSFDSWLDDQFATPMHSMLSHLEEVFNDVNLWYIMNGGDPEMVSDRPNWVTFNYAWWDLNMTTQDLLRQRMAMALSEIFVISLDTDLGNFGYGAASFYDMLARNAFGNFEDLLLEVSLHPCMGYYLSHVNNPRTNEAENIHPDENYAREIMQLFSVGLHMLNQDGTIITDNDGNPVPTYTQFHIKELAKVFTGLGYGEVVENEWLDQVYFGQDIWLIDLTYPMQMFQDWHEPGTKELLDGTIIPDGQTGMEDIQMAVHQLFMHPNVGPFISKQLIQRLVKSNPTPEYVGRVASAFNDNGSGVRGDMQAVIKAILLDEEARSCEWSQHEDQGMLRSPMLRYTQFARSVESEQFYERYWNVAYSFMDEAGMHTLFSPTVFNFYRPDFQPNGRMAEAELVGPEYQIHNARTSIGYINQVNAWSVWNSLLNNWEQNDPNTIIETSDLEALARDPEALINELDLMFTYGNLTERTRQILKSTASEIVFDDYRWNRVRMLLYLIAISPDFTILK